VTFFFFLWILFPGEYLAGYINKAVNRSGYNLKLTMKEARPTLFPVGIKMKGVGVEFQNMPPISAESLSVGYGLTSIFRKQHLVTFSCDAYNGEVHGKVRVSKERSGDISFEKLKVAGLDLEAMGPILSVVVPGYTIKGKLDAKMNYSSDGRGNGDASFKAKDLSLAKANLMFGMNNLDFDEISMKADIKNNKIQIDQCDINGKELKGKIEGSVFIRTPFKDSTLRLTGTLKPEKDFVERLKSVSPMGMLLAGKVEGGGALSFSISGTVRAPAYAMN
jgi:type II secretion system protein N